MKSEKKYLIPDLPFGMVEEEMVVYEKKTMDFSDPVLGFKIINRGISPFFLERIMDDYALTKQETADWISISPKTLDRHFTSSKPFKRLQADRILELAAFFQKGVEVFGQKEKFLKWLDTVSVALGHTTPRGWLGSSQGIRAITEELGRIEHGIFA